MLGAGKKGGLQPLLICLSTYPIFMTDLRDGWYDGYLIGVRSLGKETGIEWHRFCRS